MSENEAQATPAPTHCVLINDEEQYSLWPLGKEIPAGWREVFQGDEPACIAYVDEVWTDLRPKSVRERQGG